VTFPSLDAMREGYETCPVTDAVGETSAEAHQAGLDRIALAGGKPASVVQVGCELQRDWGRQETAEGFHADPVRRQAATGRGSQRARRQWSWCGPLRRAPRSAASPLELAGDVVWMVPQRRSD